MEWPPRQLRATSMVSPFSNLWLPDQELGMWGGEFRAFSARVVKGECSWMLPSWCPTAFPEWVWREGRPPDRESSGNPVASSGRGVLMCPRWQPNPLVGSVIALAGTLASRPLFWKYHMGRSASCSMEHVGFFLFFI